jgi:NAD(P)-dependent dehydrogenase (short-subunit alcohol dehydrogenase family)
MTDNSFRLDGKAAIVVGAALGIGRAIALAFADAGAKVACGLSGKPRLISKVPMARRRHIAAM